MSSLQCPTTILFTRHGEATYEKPVWADEGGSLTPLGRRQAAELADALAGRRVAHVWTSTLARAVQTGEVAAARLGVSVTTRRGLREFGVGDFAGTPLDDDPFPAHFARWIEGDLAHRLPGGETGAELVRRFADVVEEIADAHPGETVLVVAHGGLLSLGLRAVFDVSGVTPRRLANCDVVECLVDADGRTCVRWGGW